MSKNNERILASYIVEIRHQPYMPFIDEKGKLASIISRSKIFKLSLWSPSNDRVDFMSEDGKSKPFITFQNYGLALENVSASTANEKIGQFIEELLNGTDLANRDIVRIGVRSNFLADNGQTFDEIKKKYQVRYLNLNSEALKIFEADIVDIGAPFNFKVSDTVGFNTMSGAMGKSQMRVFFPNVRNFPDGLLPSAGLYFDIDYFTTKVGVVDKNTIIKLVKESLSNSSEIFRKFKNFILL